MPDTDQPPYMQVAERIRRRILDGQLKEGAKLPPQRELAQQEGVAVATLGRSLDHLQVEGYIVTSRRGTFVANAPSVAPSSYDRITRVLRTGSVLGEGETMLVTAAELVAPPQYVAEIFDLDEGDQVVRRQWHTGKGSKRLMLAVTWYPARFAALVPELLSTAPGKGTGLLPRIQEAAGRRVTAGRDDVHSRDADEREASFLGVRVGSPILAGAHRLWDDQGVIEYGEWCLPYRLTVGYEYSFEAVQDGA
ncbi:MULTISPECIES: GntR family transcriptional regulator [Streptomyces]|uniref:GntR family transcriptional regulator n=1 Tax=Streptomyces dengpaensis TaxID=2049881 RepID=A0ABN5I6H7_9ACTN|nr:MULTISPECIES: GntR family transcriptional regulator [Streptomyces]AVH58656.1 GntR family transcriptional regulator [Streptomyces dengpaensis]PIB11283.1 GntR family transcriptional regulator [Streptomyces sp. HG99]